MTKRESQLLAQNYIQKRFAVCTSKTTDFVAQFYLLTHHYPDSMLFFLLFNSGCVRMKTFHLKSSCIQSYCISTLQHQLFRHWVIMSDTLFLTLFLMYATTQKPISQLEQTTQQLRERQQQKKPEPIDEEPVSGYKTLGEASNKQTFQPLKIWRAFKYQSAHSSHRFSPSDKIHRHSHNLSKNIDRKQHRYKRFIERNIQNLHFISTQEVGGK